MVNEQINANTTVRLLINHLNTDDTTGDSPGQRTTSLNTKVTIHLSITTPMGNPIKITCDAYVANIRYPLILGYPTLKQYDLFRQLPSFWSPNDQVGYTTDQGLLGYAERHQQPRNVGNILRGIVVWRQDLRDYKSLSLLAKPVISRLL